LNKVCSRACYRLYLLDLVLRVRDWKHKDDGLDNRPSIIKASYYKSDDSCCSHADYRAQPGKRGAWSSIWVQARATKALVTRDLSVSLRDSVEALEGTVLFFLSKMSLTFTIKGIWDYLTFSGLVSHVIHVTFVISLSACAWYSHSLSFEVLSIEAFRLLLSSDICHLLS
jgi:hypothetical protein